MYRVIHEFTDLQDNNHKYRVGDNFPHSESVKVSQERIDCLASEKNRLRTALIEPIEIKSRGKKKSE